MTTELNAITGNAFLRLLLGVLRREYPGAIDILVIHMTMQALGYQLDEHELSASLRRLQDNGLVRFEHRHTGAHSIQFAYLTAKGFDFLDSLSI